MIASYFTIHIVVPHPGKLYNIFSIMGLLPDTQNCDMRMRWQCRERFPCHLLQIKSLVSDPGIRHSRRMRTRIFVYLVRGPWPGDDLVCGCFFIHAALLPRDRIMLYYHQAILFRYDIKQCAQLCYPTGMATHCCIYIFAYLTPVMQYYQLVKLILAVPKPVEKKNPSACLAWPLNVTNSATQYRV